MIDTEETYRELVRITIEHKIYFLDYIKYSDADKNKKRLIWLRLMGLIDTWYET